MPWISAVLAAVLLSVAAVPARAQQPELYVVDPLKFELDAAHPPAFYVFARSGSIGGLDVKVIEIKDAAGRVYSTAWLCPSYDPAVSATGTRVTLEPQPGGFAAYGTYSVTLSLSGKGAAPLTKLATLVHAKPEITAPDLKDLAIAVTRSSTMKPYDVAVVNSGPPLNGVTVAGGALRTVGTAATLAGGRVKAVFPSAFPSGTVSGKIELSGLDAGEYQTRLIVTLPGSTSTIDIPFIVRVTDHWFWPLLTIAAGAGLAFIVSLIANRLKPHQEVQAMVETIADALYGLRGLTADVSRQVVIDGLSDRLRTAEQSASAGRLADARTTLEALRIDIDTLRNAIVEESRTAIAAEAEVAALVASLRSTAQQGDIDRMQAALDRIAQHLGARRYQAAAAEIAELKKVISDLAAAASRVRRAKAQGAALTPEAFALVTDRADAWVVGRALTFTIPQTVSVDGAAVIWNFGDGEEREEGRVVQKTYRRTGRYRISASVRVSGVETAQLLCEVTIGESHTGIAFRHSARASAAYDVLLSVIGLVVAIATGLWLLYAGKTFGSVSQYLEAFLWGFGIDNSVRGLAAVMTKVKG